MDSKARRNFCPQHFEIWPKSSRTKENREEKTLGESEGWRGGNTLLGICRRDVGGIVREARKLHVDATAGSDELVPHTFTSHTLAFKVRNGIGHREVFHQICQELGCDVIGLQETRRDGYTFTAVGRTCFFSGPDTAKHDRKGIHGIGLAVRESIIGLAVRESIVAD